MFTIGLDFDNTIVCYDNVFQKVAIADNLVPIEFATSKNAIRDYLRRIDQEDRWTELQGYIYGKCMTEANPFPGALDFFKYAKLLDIRIFIISHRTRYPFLGPKYDLHEAAMDWISQLRLDDSQDLILSSDSIFFELTKSEKIRRITDLGCTHFVDDLPEILDMLPSEVDRILFSPEGQSKGANKCRMIRSWFELPSFLSIS